MVNVNKVWIMGRLTADPEQKQTQSGIAVSSFTVAVNRRFHTEQTDFIDCVAFRKTAEVLCKYFKKGSAVICFGAIQVDSYKDKEGKNRKSFRVVIDDIQFGAARAAEHTAPTSENKQPDNDIPDDFTEVTDDDLPF